MKKKLIVLAVAGATVAPAIAMAQTANPVTLYGRAYLTLDTVEAKGGGLSRRTVMRDQASHIGVRGTEDLGGGLKAFFQLETAFAPDQNDNRAITAAGVTTTSTTANAFATRNSGVGLQGGWGSILMGRWDMPFKTTTIALDPYGDLTIGGITVANNTGNDGTSFDRRDTNVVQYWSPNFGGFAFRLAAQTNELKTSSANTRNQGGSVTFTRGPVYIVGAYEEHKDTPSSGAEQKGYALGGSVAFGPVKLALLAEEFKQTNRTKRKSWLANVVWTMGNSQFIYQYQQAKDGGLSGTAQPDCKVHQPGWQYNFSRRTFFLAQYAKVDNNSAANCGSGIIPISAGQDPQGFAVGLRHVF